MLTVFVQDYRGPVTPVYCSSTRVVRCYTSSTGVQVCRSNTDVLLYRSSTQVLV
jgi:hypothetical protein